MAMVFTETKTQGLWKKKILSTSKPSTLNLFNSIAKPTPGAEVTPSPTTQATPDPGQPHPPSPRTSVKDVIRQNFPRLGKSASRVSLFLASEDNSLTTKNGSESDHRDGTDGTAPKVTRKFLYSLASISMNNRRASRPVAKNGLRRESGSGVNRLMGIVGTMRRGSANVEQRATTFNGVNKMASLVNFMGLKHRAQLRLKEAKSKVMWRKLRFWSGIIYTLCRLLRKHAASAITDPSSPFYTGDNTDVNSLPLDSVLDDTADHDNDMLFDPSRFKANTQMRISQEVQRILTKPAEERTPEEIHFAMIGLRNVDQLAIYPVRMQQNLAQFAEFQSFQAKRRILRQGHVADGFYVILYGNVIVAVKNEDTGFAKIVVELPRGETFGDLAIVSGGTRNSSVLTKTYTQLLYVSKSVYETIFMTGGMKCINDSDHLDFLSSLSFLRGWPIQKLFDKDSEKYVRFMYIQRNGVIMRDSNYTDWLLVVKSGSVKVLKKLVRSKPTVSRRSGLYRHQSCASAFQSFVTDAREFDRYLSCKGITLPPPLHVHGEQEEEEEEEEEDEVGTVGDREEEYYDVVMTDTEGKAITEVAEENVDNYFHQRVYQHHNRHRHHNRHHHRHHHHHHHNHHQEPRYDHLQYDDDHDFHQQEYHYHQQQQQQQQQEYHHHHQHHDDDDHHHHHHHSQKQRQRKRGMVYPNYHEEDEEDEDRRRRSRVQSKVRPHTTAKGCVTGPHTTPGARKALSARHPSSVLTSDPTSVSVTASGPKSAVLPKRSKRSTPKIRFDVNHRSRDEEHEIPQEAKFALAKRTILDDMDAAYLRRTHAVTEADLNPQFVIVQTLTKGNVFGLAPLVFPDQPGLCLVSNGAECMFIDKRFYMDHCSPELSRRLKTEVSPYPSDSKLQQDLVNRINWDVYKQVVMRQVYQQAPSHVTFTPL